MYLPFGFKGLNTYCSSLIVLSCLPVIGCKVFFVTACYFSAYLSIYLFIYCMFISYRSGSKSLDGARLAKPKLTVAPTSDRPLSQQGKIILWSALNNDNSSEQFSSDTFGHELNRRNFVILCTRLQLETYPWRLYSLWRLLACRLVHKPKDHLGHRYHCDNSVSHVCNCKHGGGANLLGYIRQV